MAPLDFEVGFGNILPRSLAIWHSLMYRYITEDNPKYEDNKPQNPSSIFFHPYSLENEDLFYLTHFDVHSTFLSFTFSFEVTYIVTSQRKIFMYEFFQCDNMCFFMTLFS